MCCCDCGRNKTKTIKQDKEDKLEIESLDKSYSSIYEEKNKILDFEKNTDYQDSIITQNSNGMHLEDYYFQRPEKNIYSNDQLFEMGIEEIILGVLPTFYKKDNKFEKSFHPFFYLRLENDDIEDFGVIVQYLVVPKDAKSDQIHLYEKDGIEFIEKTYSDFENEFKLIFKHGADEYIMNIRKYIISFSSLQFNRMTLGQFFELAIPKKGEWVQSNLKGLKKTCFDFCMSAIENVNVKKKKKNSIREVKSNLKKLIEKSKGAKYYDHYNKKFEELFNVITE